LAIGDRSFPAREKRLEFQHPNVAVFNIPLHNHPPKYFGLGDEVKEADGLAHKQDYSPGKPEDKMVA
jgi:hypothetical protein